MSVLDPQRRRRSTLILLLLTSITLLSLDYQGFRPLERVQSAVRSVVDPLADSSDSVTSPVTNAWRSFTEFEDMEAENARLQEELAELQGGAIRASAAEETLRELLDEIDIDFSGGAETVVGQVIDRPGNFESYSIEIDRGANDGVVVGMPVVTGAGLVGKIVDVQDNFSRVRLLHEPDFGIGIRVVGTGEFALARGQGLGEDLLVQEGITAFPPDLPIGVISAVEFDNRLLEKRVSINLVSDLENLRFVTVVLWTVDGESAP